MALKPRATARRPRKGVPCRYGSETWRLAEHFVAGIDAPYFAHSEFLHVLLTEMDSALRKRDDETLYGEQLSSSHGPTSRLGAQTESKDSSIAEQLEWADGRGKTLWRTRGQWTRLRGRMCTVFPAGCARPRRLSRSFLACERMELETYRKDVRAALCGDPLPRASDATSGTELGALWRQRYAFPQPTCPEVGADALVVRAAVHGGANVQHATLQAHPPFRQAPLWLAAKFVKLERSGNVTVRLPDGRTVQVPDLLVSYPGTDKSSRDAGEAGMQAPCTPQKRARSQSPSPVCTPSPRRSVTLTSKSGSGVELNVHVRGVAESVRLLERKDALLQDLSSLNSTAENELRHEGEISEVTRVRHAATLRNLALVNARLDVVMPRIAHSLESPQRSRHDRRENQPWGDGRDQTHGAEVTASTPTPQRIVERYGRGFSPSERHTAQPRGFVGDMAPYAGGDAPDLFDPRPPVRNAGPWNQNPAFERSAAHMTDFRTSSGAAVLSKTLAREALSRLPDNDKLKSAPASLRADVIECVSTCTALLTRARLTRSSESMDELVDALRVKCPQNEPLLQLVRNAIRDFDTTSSESQ